MGEQMCKASGLTQNEEQGESCTFNPLHASPATITSVSTSYHHRICTCPQHLKHHAQNTLCLWLCMLAHIIAALAELPYSKRNHFFSQQALKWLPLRKRRQHAGKLFAHILCLLCGWYDGWPCQSPLSHVTYAITVLHSFIVTISLCS